MMKKISYLLLSLVFIISVFALCSCGNEEYKGDDKEVSSEKNNEKETPSTPANNDKDEEESSSEDDGKVTYKVTVVDDAGNPVVDTIVQCCKDKDSCTPSKTDANGVAEFSLVEADYDVKFAKFPEGYEYSSDEEVFKFESGKYELTITLKKK